MTEDGSKVLGGATTTSLDVEVDRPVPAPGSDEDETSNAEPLMRSVPTGKEANIAAFNRFVLEQKDDENEPPAKPGSLENSQLGSIIDKARDYQTELFDRAKEENIIAVLDTGSGKTLIAALLIRHFLQQELISRAEHQQPRIVFFLVNSVHLARQQAQFLKQNLPTPPIALFGNSSDDLWKKADWERIRSSNDIVVCTAAVLDQCLMHSYITIDEISLIVFDEAHHCKKNHPYATIIRDHYVKCKGRRPHIFGMTASPVDSKRDVTTVARDLEDLLHAKIVTSSNLSVFDFAAKARDDIWLYRRHGGEFETDLHQKLSPLCHVVDALSKSFSYAREASAELGSWFSDRVWSYALGDSERSSIIARDVERNSLCTSMGGDTEAKEALLSMLENARIIVKHHACGPPCLDDKETPNNGILAKPEISPKVRKLYDKLRETFSTQPLTRGIVFVDQRLTAYLLCDFFELMQVPGLRPSVLIGVSQSALGGESWRDQESIMRRFRDGEFNLIFSTSVAEEGIDIPQCNLVVRFDPVKTAIQYMQSKGRARMMDSVYAHMQEEQNKNHEASIHYAIETEAYIRKWCQSLPLDRVLGQGTKLKRLLAQDAALKSFTTKTGTVANSSNALLLLSRYVSSLRSNLHAASSEIYEEIVDGNSGMFRYKVILPKVEHDFASKVKGGRGDKQPNKVLARRSAAFDCICKLRANDLLDDNLDSIFEKVKPSNSNAKIAINDKTEVYEKKVKPDFWQSSGAGSQALPTNLYATHISVHPMRPLRRALGEFIMLTRAEVPEIPAFRLFLEDNVPATVRFTAVPKPFPVSESILHSLTTYTLNGIMEDCFNKSYKTNSTCMSYWIAPVGNIHAVSLEDFVNVIEVRGASAPRQRWVPGEVQNWLNAFLVDPCDGKYRYFSQHVVPGKSILERPPPTAQTVKKRHKDTIIEFTDSMWRKRGTELSSLMDRYDALQPVLMAEIVGTHRELLWPNPGYQFPVVCHVAPQPLEIGRVSTVMAATYQLLPAIIHRLESHLIAFEAFTKLDLLPMPLGLALEAYTKSHHSQEQDEILENNSCEVAQYRSSYIPFGDYERLEFLGDAFLKLSTTITVFLRTTCDEEGMHCKRMALLSNSRLHSTACASHHQLFRYIRSGPSDRLRDTWYPEFLEQTHGRVILLSEKHCRHTLGDKTIADVCEATIGACILATCQLRGCQKFDLGIKAVTKLVEDPDHAITSWMEIAPMYHPPSWSLRTNDPVAADLASRIAEVTGYRFKQPTLLRSAFTHPSEASSPVPDLQRLEFLGDACFDWVCVWWLFDANPTRGPQWLTEHKMAMVSNRFLATLAVTLGFHLHFFISSPALWDDIQRYATKVSQLYNDGDCEADFWTDECLSNNVPKACADVVEAYLGALIIDSGFDFGEIELFFERHVKKYFVDIERYDTFANRHPTTFISKLLQETFKCQKFSLETKTIVRSPSTSRSRGDMAGYGDGGGDAVVQGSICNAGWVVHGRIVAAAKGKSTRYSKARASQAAMKILGSIKVDDFRKTWGCDCPKVEDEDCAKVKQL